MTHYLVMCKSLTYAQRSARALERSGITVGVTKAPQSLTQEGCSYCVRVPDRRLRDSLRILDTAGMKSGKVYAVDDKGRVTEVRQ